MANPNIVNVTSILGTTTYYTPTGTAAVVLLPNTAASGTVFKINQIVAANVNGTSAVDTTVSIYSNGAVAQGSAPSGGVAYPIVSTVSVPADASLIVTDKTTAIYLMEGNSITITSGTASGITYSISYEVISLTGLQMSNRYKGAVISATPPTTSGGESGTASGVWTLEQQLQLTAASLWPIQPLPKYIEDVFSTYLYTGTGASLTITNGIDLSTNGGLVWLKSRSTAAAAGHKLTDTARGAGNALTANATNGSLSDATLLSAFNTTGFTLGTYGGTNNSGDTYVSWSFRKQPKFFDIQTWTGSGANRTISHALGSVPGCILVKRTDTGGYDWAVYHRSLANTQYLVLNDTAAAATGATWWNSTTPTSSVFSLGTDASVNASGGTYVAYVFAHDAGGFGLTGTDNVISCGTFTGAGATTPVTVNIGFEPQWILAKRTSGTSSWSIVDNMRGFVATTNGNVLLYPDTIGVDDTGNYIPGQPTSTGFNGLWTSGQTHIYIAIRRGPMKTPTVGTSVFSPITNSATTGTVNTTGFPVDMGIVRWRTGTDSNFLRSRLQGVSSTTTESGAFLKTNATDAESTAGGITRLWDNTGFQTTSGFSTYSTVYWNFGRAPGFFDEVCYTGTGSATTFAHNLAAVPELMIVKKRSATGAGSVYSAAIGNTQQLELFSSSGNSAAFVDTTQWNSTTPTSSVFTVGTNGAVNGSGATYVAYLFATCAGVSKVGSYTGNAGYTVTVPCGFTTGVRFVLIKRTDSTGDWYVWDSARGIIAGNDPYLALNDSAAEVTGTDYVDTYAAGFEVTSTAPAGLNATGGTYIFLAIA